MSTDAPVHIVDDDLAVRQSLAFLLATDGQGGLSCSTSLCGTLSAG